MNPLLNLVTMCVFIGGVLLLLFSGSGFVSGSIQAILRETREAQIDLRTFLKTSPEGRNIQGGFLFSEKSVYSMAHKFVGRFDSAVLHWDDSPVLDLMIERKFPLRYLPGKAWPEDFFQAGLYALALLEMGVSCRSTRLVVIYCKQDDAKTCLEKLISTDCFSCKKARVFSKRFKPREVLKQLAKLDEVWYKGRRPVATPYTMKCRACPFGRNSKCNYTLA